MAGSEPNHWAHVRDFFDGGAWGVLLLAELLAASGAGDEDLLRLGGIAGNYTGSGVYLGVVVVGGLGAVW